MIDLYYFDEDVKKGEVSDLEKLSGKKKWIDVTNMTKDESDLLQKTFNLHPLTSEDLFHPGTRIKIEEFPDYLFFVFYGIKKSKKIEMVELNFVLGRDFLITNHKIKIESFECLKRDPKKLSLLFPRGMDFVFHKLLDQEIDNFFPVLEKIDDMIECIEEEVAENPKPKLLAQILSMKKNIVLIKKVTLPQREKISFLTKNEYKIISKKAIPYFRDVYDHAVRVSDTIDNYREALGGTFDAYMSSVSNNTNEVMKTLSVIATIVLPLTILSGIFGTNFDQLPWQHTPYGFWIMLLTMFLFAFGVIVFLKRRKWF